MSKPDPSSRPTLRIVSPIIPELESGPAAPPPPPPPPAAAATAASRPVRPQSPSQPAPPPPPSSSSLSSRPADRASLTPAPATRTLDTWSAQDNPRTSKFSFASRPSRRPRTANGFPGSRTSSPLKQERAWNTSNDTNTTNTANTSTTTTVTTSVGADSLRSKSASEARTPATGCDGAAAEALQGRSQSATSFVASPSRSRPTALGEALSKHSRGASRIFASIKATASRSSGGNKHAAPAPAASSSSTSVSASAQAKTSLPPPPPPPLPPPPPQRSRRASHIPNFAAAFRSDPDSAGHSGSMNTHRKGKHATIYPGNSSRMMAPASAESDTSLARPETPSSGQNHGQTRTKQPRLHHFLSRTRSLRALDEFFHSNGSSSSNASPAKSSFNGDSNNNNTATATAATSPNGSSHPYRHGFGGHSRGQSVYPGGGRFVDSTLTISEIPTEDEAAEEQQYMMDNRTRQRDAQVPESHSQQSMPPPAEVDSEPASPLSDTAASHSPTVISPQQTQSQVTTTTGKNNVTETVVSEDEPSHPSAPPLPLPPQPSALAKTTTTTTTTTTGQNVSNGKKFTDKAKGILDWMRPGVSSDACRSHASTPAPEDHVFQVINLPLHEQVRRTRIGKRLNGSKDKTEYWLPALPFRCIDYLNSKAEVEGLYRIPGSHRDVLHWKRRFDIEYDIDLFEEPDLYDVNIISSMFKAWLRELPDEILPSSTQALISEKCAGATSVPQLLRDEICKLPPQNYYLLFAITCHLNLLHADAENNKMDFHNICVCFQPCMRIDSFCFTFLVRDWKSCWQEAECKLEDEYLAKELDIEEREAAAREEEEKARILASRAKEEEAGQTTATAATSTAKAASSSTPDLNTTNNSGGNNNNGNNDSSREPPKADKTSRQLARRTLFFGHSTKSSLPQPPPTTTAPVLQPSPPPQPPQKTSASASSAFASASKSKSTSPTTNSNDDSHGKLNAFPLGLGGRKKAPLPPPPKLELSHTMATADGATERAGDEQMTADQQQQQQQQQRQEVENDNDNDNDTNSEGTTGNQGGLVELPELGPPLSPIRISV